MTCIENVHDNEKRGTTRLTRLKKLCSSINIKILRYLFSRHFFMYRSFAVFLIAKEIKCNEICEIGRKENCLQNGHQLNLLP